MNFFEILSFDFAKRALVAGTLICLCAAILGVNLVLKRFSMLGDGLSHVSFGSAAIALALGVSPLQISIPVVIVAAFLLLRIKTNGRIKGDAATAIISSSALAIGVIVATLTSGMNTDINNYMFGSILALNDTEVYISVGVAVVIIALYTVFYQKIFACTFDEGFALSSGVNVKLYNSLNAIFVAVIVVVGMRIMGALLISSIITFPALSAMRVCNKYKSCVVLSGIISVLAFLVGISLSFLFDMPTGSSVVVVNLIIFIVMSIVRKIRN